MKHVRVITNPYLEPGKMVFGPDPDADDFDLFASTIQNSRFLILVCHPDDECKCRDRLAIVQEHTI